jgi:hypothetical protein
MAEFTVQGRIRLIDETGPAVAAAQKRIQSLAQRQQNIIRDQFARGGMLTGPLDAELTRLGTKGPIQLRKIVNTVEQIRNSSLDASKGLAIINAEIKRLETPLKSGLIPTASFGKTGFAQAFEHLKQQMVQVPKVTKEAERSMNQWEKQLQKTGGSVRQVTQAVREQNREIQKTATATKQATKQATGLNQMWMMQSRFAQNLSASMQGLLIALSALQGNVMGLAFGLLFLQFTTNPLLAAFSALGVIIGGLGVKAGMAAASTEQLRREITFAVGDVQKADLILNRAQFGAEQFGFLRDDLAKAFTELERFGVLSERTAVLVQNVAAGTGKTATEIAESIVSVVRDGSTSSLRQLGFTKKQIEQFKTLEDVVVRLEERFKGAAEAQKNSLRGVLGSTSAAFKSLFEAIGLPFLRNVLLPVLQELNRSIFNTGRAARDALPFIERFTKAIGVVLVNAIRLVTKLLKLAGDAVKKFLATFKPTFGILEDILSELKDFISNFPALSAAALITALGLMGKELFKQAIKSIIGIFGAALLAFFTQRALEEELKRLGFSEALAEAVSGALAGALGGVVAARILGASGRTTLAAAIFGAIAGALIASTPDEVTDELTNAVRRAFRKFQEELPNQGFVGAAAEGIAELFANIGPALEARLIGMGIGALIGAAIAAALGANPIIITGAAISAAALVGSILDTIILPDGTLDIGQAVFTGFATALGATIGGLLGASIGGITGGLIGSGIGALLGGAIATALGEYLADAEGNLRIENAVILAAGAGLGAALGGLLAGPFGAAIGAILGGTVATAIIEALGLGPDRNEIAFKSFVKVLEQGVEDALADFQPQVEATSIIQVFKNVLEDANRNLQPTIDEPLRQLKLHIEGKLKNRVAAGIAENQTLTRDMKQEIIRTFLQALELAADTFPDSPEEARNLANQFRIQIANEIAAVTEDPVLQGQLQGSVNSLLFKVQQGVANDLPTFSELNAAIDELIKNDVFTLEDAGEAIRGWVDVLRDATGITLSENSFKEITRVFTALITNSFHDEMSNETAQAALGNTVEFMFGQASRFAQKSADAARAGSRETAAVWGASFEQAMQTAEQVNKFTQAMRALFNTAQPTIDRTAENSGVRTANAFTDSFSAELQAGMRRAADAAQEILGVFAGVTGSVIGSGIDNIFGARMSSRELISQGLTREFGGTINSEFGKLLPTPGATGVEGPDDPAAFAAFQAQQLLLSQQRLAEASARGFEQLLINQSGLTFLLNSDPSLNPTIRNPDLSNSAIQAALAAGQIALNPEGNLVVNIDLTNSVISSDLAQEQLVQLVTEGVAETWRSSIQMDRI